MKYVVGFFILWLLMRNRFGDYAALLSAKPAAPAAGE